MELKLIECVSAVTPKGLQSVMFTTSFWLSLLFLSRVSASILVCSISPQSPYDSLFGQVSDVYWAQGDCDTAVDPVRSLCIPG